MKTNELSQQEQVNINGGTSVGHENPTPENSFQQSPDGTVSDTGGDQPAPNTNVPYDGSDKQPPLRFV